MNTIGNKELIDFRAINSDEISLELFDNFHRRQVVTKCWRKSEFGLIIKDDPSIADWTNEDYAKMVVSLKQTLESGGGIFGAFVYGELKGFASVEGKKFGSCNQYIDLSEIHVSEEARGHGIGTRLFEMAKAFARSRGAKKLYVSAHACVENHSFYRAMGCVEADESDLAHTEKFPDDCQLECRV